MLSTRSNELSSAWALLVVIGTALLMDLIGLATALGAFLAGVLLADSEYRHELEADIEPFKGLLMGLFFIAVGMTVNLGLIAAQPLSVLAIVLALVTVKALALLACRDVAKKPMASSREPGDRAVPGRRVRVRAVRGGAKPAGRMAGDADRPAGGGGDAVDGGDAAAADRPRPPRWARRAADNRREFDAIDEESPVIIAGFGRFGQIVGRVLRMTRIQFTALEIDTTQVDFLRRFGNEIYYGDAARIDLLRAAKADKARLMVVAIDDVEASMRTVETVRRNFPDLRIVARARNRPHAFRLMAPRSPRDRPRDVPVEPRGGPPLARRAGLTPSDAREYVKMFKEHDERVLQEQYSIRHDEAALIASAKKFSADLERLFDADARQRPR